MPSHSLFDQVSHGSLGNKIFDILRDRILNEEYENGQKLNELSCNIFVTERSFLFLQPHNSES